jgi:ATP-dependent Lhr-like helicase
MTNYLHPGLKELIVKKGWKDMSDIQKVAFDPIFCGESCIIEAPTSGGKTEAVFFPVLSRISGTKFEGIRVLYLAPLKALLNDIEYRAKEYANACGLEAFKWHGDVNQAQKVAQTYFPAQILLTTPESLEAILLRKANWYEMFANLETVIIDEAHSFAQSERGSHLISLLERLQYEIKKTPQRIAITATIGNPADLLRWMLGQKIAEGREVRVNNKPQKQIDIEVYFFEESDISSENTLNKKLYELLSVNPKFKSLVFRNSRSHTEDSARYINEKNADQEGRLPVIVRTHHSSVSKYYREEAERLIRFKNEGALNAIISTSTLELGIDIGELNQVIQVGDLASSGSFLQRIGRTGRRAGKPQLFRGLCNDAKDLLLLTASINLGLRGISECISFSKRAFHILAHQIICLILQKNGCSKEALWEILSGTYCFSHISFAEFLILIHYMVNEDFLRYVDNEILVTSTRTEQLFLRSNWRRLFAIFETGPVYHAVDGKKIIGSLDSNFIRSQEVPFVVMLAGMEWKAIKVNHETQQVSLVKHSVGRVPKWKVFRSSVIPFEIAQEVGNLLMNTELPYFLENKARVALTKEREKVAALGWFKGHWICQAVDIRTLIVWTFSGDRINRTLATFLKNNGAADVDSDFMRVQFTLPHNCEPESTPFPFLRNLLLKTSTGEVEKSIGQSMKKIPFSKFSACVPEVLSKLAVIEKAFDIDGLCREVNITNLIVID